MDQPLRVGQLAEATRVSVKTIRDYDQVRVLPQP
jgi:DNA-binding transcriptional MerR regulator